MDELLQAVLDKGDEDTWAVFADHLQETGDVRGELWALEQRLGRGMDADATELSRARNRILAAHVADWLGPLLAELDRDDVRAGAYARELRALERGRARWAQLTHLPGLFRGQDHDLQLGWRAGFVVAARIRGLDDAVGRVLRGLLDSPAARLLSCLDLDFDHLVERGADHMEAVFGPGRLASVRQLRLTYLGKTMWPASWLAAAAPRLRRLSAENPDLSGLRHPGIERLRIGGQRLDQVLAGLGRAGLPALVHLTIDRFDNMARDPAMIADFLSGRATPWLRTLRLGDIDAGIADHLLDAVAGSDLGRRLGAIELEWPDEHPELARLLAEYRAELGGLVATQIRERAEPFCADS